jgi:hypothetical protein
MMELEGPEVQIAPEVFATLSERDKRAINDLKRKILWRLTTQREQDALGVERCTNGKAAPAP